MKILITFGAIGILFMTLLIFQSDFGAFLQTREEVKRAASEIAGGAVLIFEEESYAEGYMVLEAEAAKQVKEDMLRQKQSDNPKWQNAKATVTIDNIEDKYAHNQKLEAVITAEVLYENEDFFRLPFLKKSKISRSAAYGVEGR